MKAALIIGGVGLATLASGYAIGKQLRKKRQPLGCASSLRGLGPCRSYASRGDLGQASHSQFALLMRKMGESVQRGKCGEARRALLGATHLARSTKEKGSLRKAYRKLQRCEINS